jgi:hypothetical protein
MVDVNTSREAVGVIFSFLLPTRAEAGLTRDLQNRGQKRRNYFHVFTYPAVG